MTAAPAYARPVAPPRPATLLHTSDCHLDHADGGTSQRAFAAAIDLSIELDVDALLITGDLFDHSRVRDPILEWTAEQLDRAQRPVVLIVGNHDCLQEASVHHRFSVTSRCQQVQFLDDPNGTTVEVPGTDIVVWGRAMVEHEPSFRPLHGYPGRVADRWCVVAGHGLTVHDINHGRSSPIFPEDIEALDADYVALGHVHAFDVVREQPLTVYAGATAYSRHGAPGCVVVNLTAGQPAEPRWVPLEIDGSMTG
jgi:DNA repair exonuclease SbcCD nuclease subunit